MISDAQYQANVQNAQLGGVKTPEGKTISKMNAQKHGVLSKLLTDEEAQEANSIHRSLIKQFKPQGMIEQILVERLAVWTTGGCVTPFAPLCYSTSCKFCLL